MTAKIVINVALARDEALMGVELDHSASSLRVKGCV
jgi:hypothetical protein